MARDKKSKINDDTPGLSLSYLVPSLPPPRGKLVVSARIYQQKVSCLPLTGGDSLSLSFSFSAGNQLEINGGKQGSRIAPLLKCVGERE